MTTGPGRRALSLLYLLPFSAFAGVLIVVGAAADFALPAAFAGRYRRSMLVVLAGLARPLDALTDQATAPVAAGVSSDSAP